MIHTGHKLESLLRDCQWQIGKFQSSQVEAGYGFSEMC